MPQEIYKKAKRVIPLLVFLSLFCLQLVLVSAATTANPTYDQILAPITTIYNLVKYAVTVIAGLVLLFAGISYITGGSDPGKREKAKNMIMYVILGLGLIWVAPYIVNLMLGN